MGKHTHPHQKGIYNLQDMLGTEVEVHVTDGSHVIEEVQGILVSAEDFGVTLHKKYRNQMRVTFYPWHSVCKIVPEPLTLRKAAHPAAED